MWFLCAVYTQNNYNKMGDCVKINIKNGSQIFYIIINT